MRARRGGGNRTGVNVRDHQITESGGIPRHPRPNHEGAETRVRPWTLLSAAPHWFAMLEDPQQANSTKPTTGLRGLDTATVSGHSNVMNVAKAKSVSRLSANSCAGVGFSPLFLCTCRRNADDTAAVALLTPMRPTFSRHRDNRN